MVPLQIIYMVYISSVSTKPGGQYTQMVQQYITVIVVKSNGYSCFCKHNNIVRIRNHDGSLEISMHLAASMSKAFSTESVHPVYAA